MTEIKTATKIISISIGAIIGIYLFYAILAPSMIITGEVFWYKMQVWGCEKKGGDYSTFVRQDKLGNEYTYQKCSFN